MPLIVEDSKMGLKYRLMRSYGNSHMPFDLKVLYNGSSVWSGRVLLDKPKDVAPPAASALVRAGGLERAAIEALAAVPEGLRSDDFLVTCWAFLGPAEA